MTCINFAFFVNFIQKYSFEINKFLTQNIVSDIDTRHILFNSLENILLDLIKYLSINQNKSCKVFTTDSKY